MKKVIGLICICVAMFALIIVANGRESERYFRIHIRAHSNEQCDQQVKLAVRNAVTEYLTPYLSYADSKQEAQKVIFEQSANIESHCNAVLKRHGYTYTAKVKVCREQFPVRKYGDLVLPDGVYDALIVELGQARGDNWWCVIYPPLCFVGEYNGTANVYYKSKLAEIIKEFSTRY